MSKYLRLSLISLTALAVLAVSVAATGRHYHRRAKAVAILDGFQEVPAVSTSASGTIYLRFDRSKKRIRYTLHYSALEGEIWQAHLHFGRAATNGGVIAFLCGTVPQPLAIPGGIPECPPSSGGTVRGEISADDIVPALPQGIDAGEIDEVVRAIKAGAVYANVHTDRFEMGEIRGQLR